ncbi:MAG: preprotein translocase subunit SecE [Candidatus Levybacteria bacterium]|nr:preprotein translocase subunit SecE [Candidatus Levybacteria bacterium]MBP9821814.1 preprotein translocase subunit SecE [Candidatus Paceibacterota bacterium]
MEASCDKITFMFTFLQEVRTELLKISWPSRKDTIELTIVVLGLSAAVGVYLGAADYLFTLGLEYLVK